MTTIKKPFLMPSDIERIYGISKEKLAAMRYKKTGPKCYTLPSRNFVYYPDDINEYLRFGFEGVNNVN